MQITQLEDGAKLNYSEFFTFVFFNFSFTFPSFYVKQC